LIQYLSQRKVLLILDNCEHLIEECSRVVEQLLKHTTQLQILVTSREGLNITGEVRFRVPSLSLPLPDEVVTPERVEDFEALQLLKDRCTTANPNFKFEPDEITSLVQICLRLDV
jgi:predicted ATPase